MDAFPYNTGADADKSRLKIIRTVTAPSQSSGRARKRDGQQMTTNRQDPDALLTREQTAARADSRSSEDALNSGIARGQSAVSIVRATCPLSLRCVEMGASASQHATSIDFGRRCVACAATPWQPSKQGGHIQRRNSMSVADIATAPARAALPLHAPRQRGKRPCGTERCLKLSPSTSCAKASC
jgi:hypothetical protein